MYQYSFYLLISALICSRGAAAVDFAQLAIGWCLDRQDAEAGYAQCIKNIVCKSPAQTNGIDPDSVACVSYGECDCSRFEDDKNSLEYFQCISSPDCAACTSAVITPTPSTSSFYGFETLTPGTYTFAYDGTTKTAVVPPPTATITDFITTTAMLTRTVTVTENPTDRTTLAQSPTERTTTPTFVTLTTVNTTSSTASTSTTSPECPAYCDCEPKYGDPDEYESCLQQPECAGCGIPFPPLPDPVPEPTATYWPNSTTTASVSSAPTPSCSSSCDCSKIEDKSSDAYFQCITNPNCEHCFVGGRRFAGRVYRK